MLSTRGWVARRVRGLLAFVAVLVVCASSAPSFGQFGPGMMPDLVSRRGVNAYCTLVGADEAQRDTALELYETTKAEYRKTMKAFQASMEEAQARAREDQDWQAVQDAMVPAMEKMQATIMSLEKQFFDDIKAILTPEQLAKWDRVERYRRREMGLRFALVSGAGVDLITVVERGKLAPEGNAEFAEALQQYELDIDAPLREFEVMQREQQSRTAETMKAFRDNPMKAMEDMNRMLERANDLAKKVRNVNRDYARRLSAMLPESSRAAFEAEVALRSFPRVYRESHAARVLNAGLGMSDLTAEQRESLTLLREQYTRDLGGANDRWARAIEQEEEEKGGAVGRMMRQFEPGGGAADESEEKKARAARRELDERTLEKAEGILTESQRAKLPEKQAVRDEPWSDMMPDPEAVNEDGEEDEE
ncbi:MAG: hypothetical protein SFY69_01320 [Planctomycetota bacterium]|nr:hypothetical protein [Planctomycetota bacterium]